MIYKTPKGGKKISQKKWELYSEITIIGKGEGGKET